MTPPRTARERPVDARGCHAARACDPERTPDRPIHEGIEGGCRGGGMVVLVASGGGAPVAPQGRTGKFEWNVRIRTGGWSAANSAVG